MPFTKVVLPTPTFLAGPTYTQQDWRRAFADIISPGVVGANDFLVSVSSGLNLSVAAGTGFIKGGDQADQGMYRAYKGSSSSLAVGTYDATNPRVDQLVLRILDADADSSGIREADLVVVPGTATSGANLSNRNGAANLTAGIEGSHTYQLLADVLIPAVSGSLTLSDRRARATVGQGNAQSTGGSTISSSVGGAGSPSDGKIIVIKGGGSPASYMTLTYDASISKYVSDPIFAQSSMISGKMSGFTFGAPSGGGYMEPIVSGQQSFVNPWQEWRPWATAGLTPQWKWIANISTNANDGTLYGSPFYRAADQNTAQGADIQVTAAEWTSGSPPGGAGSDQIRSGGWGDIPGGYSVKDFIQTTLMVKKVGGSGGAMLGWAAVWIRWVG